MTVTVDHLPSPTEMRPRWAAMSAVLTAAGLPDAAAATGQRWDFDDQAGSWLRIYFAGDGRAVLLGNDETFCETGFRDDAIPEAERVDVLAGLPAFAAQALEVHDAEQGPRVGFVCAWDGSAWSRADYDVDDGLEELARGFASDGGAREVTADVLEVADQAPQIDRAAFANLVDVDGDVDEDLVRAVVPASRRVREGAAAGLAFRETKI